ncbi:hypothetical protein ACI2OX_07200 [Bacillus sp. N9]
MKTNEAIKSNKTPNAIFSIITNPNNGFIFILWICIFELSPEPLIILSTIVAGIVAIYLGYSYQDILESVSEKLLKRCRQS